MASRNAATAARFVADLKKFDVYGLAGRFAADVAAYALVRLVELTPVATGHAKGNWQVQYFGSAVQELDVTDAIGNVTIAEGMRKLANAQPFQRISISNAVPYIRALEQGHSRQAPRGMVAITVAEIRALGPRVFGGRGGGRRGR